MHESPAFLFEAFFFGVTRGEQPLVRASRASKVAGAFLVLFWHAKENLALMKKPSAPRHQRVKPFIRKLNPAKPHPPQQKLYFFVSDFIKPPSAMIFWMKGGKGSA